MLIIDDVEFDVPISSLERSADFLDSFATRTENGDLKRKLIGVYFNYQLEFGYIADKDVYSALWKKLTEPKEFHTVTIYDQDGSYTFTAYFSSISDKMIRKEGDRNIFTGLKVHFVAKLPARK